MGMRVMGGKRRKRRNEVIRIRIAGNASAVSRQKDKAREREREQADWRTRILGNETHIS